MFPTFDVWNIVDYLLSSLKSQTLDALVRFVRVQRISLPIRFHKLGNLYRSRALMFESLVSCTCNETSTYVI